MTIYGIFSDFHGADPEPIRKMFEARKINKGICLGDFDRTSVTRKIMDIQKEYDLYVVPGNHDHSHTLKKKIYSGTMDAQGINSQMMWKEWDDDPVAKKYIMDMLRNASTNGKSGRTLKLDIGANPALIIHGGIGGSYQTEPEDLWNRIESDKDYIDTFNKMNALGLAIEIRGHDHEPQYARMDPETGFKKYETEGHGFNLFNKRKHIINPGAYFNRNYATITTDIQSNPILEFKKL